ncbi:hypothetical protein N9L06_02025 [Mariniblastus sp.]|nr:hypothetical protein [Mariniblastus sp.]
MIAIAVVALLFIALCVCVYLAAKSWHWVNVLFLMLTFIAGLAATIGLAQVGSLRYKQQKAALDAETRAERVVNQANLQVSGDIDSTTYSSDSLRGISQELALVMAGRGRVWSRGAVTADGDNVVFKFPSARPATGENGVKLENVVLFAFSEREAPKFDGDVDDAGGTRPTVPIGYIGSVRVIEETPEALTLAPEFITDPDAYTDPQRTWSLFEKMPLDRHDTVQNAFRRAAKLDDDAEIDLNELRKFLQNGLLSPERVAMEPGTREYEELLDRYTFDGVPLGAIQNWIDAAPNRIITKFEPAPEEIFVRYRFTGKSRKSYQVDSEGNLATDGPFTATGLAIESSLHLGKEVQFEKDNLVSVDSVNASGYSRSDGTQVPPFPSTEPVEEVERYYVRPLRDYPYLLASTTDASTTIAEETTRRQKSNEVQTATLRDTQAQIAERTKLTAALESDQKNLRGDQQVVTEVLETKTSAVEQLIQKIDGIQSQLNAISR